MQYFPCPYNCLKISEKKVILIDFFGYTLSFTNSIVPCIISLNFIRLAFRVMKMINEIDPNCNTNATKIVDF